MPKAKYQNDGTYYYTYINTGEYLPNGKPKYKKIRGKTISKVDEKVKQYNENKIYQIEPSTITVEQWYKEWFNAYKSDCKPNTKNFYEIMYNKHIKPSIGNYKVSQIRENHCQSILTNMNKSGLSKSTVQSVRKILFSMFDKAVIAKIIIINPAQRLNAKGKNKVERRHLTKEERKDTLNAITVHPFGQFVAFLYFFGLRRGEALALTGKDISDTEIKINKQYVFPDNNKAVLSIPKTKAGVRSIPIPQKAREYIDFDNLPDGLLFADNDGNPLCYSAVKRKWKSFVKFTYGEHSEITEHYLRHNYCCMLFEKDVNIKVVQKLVGHEDIKTTLGIYTHYTEIMEEKDTSKVLNIG